MKSPRHISKQREDALIPLFKVTWTVWSPLAMLISVAGRSFSAVHDMKEDLVAPLALQERALAELLSLKVWPAPELRLYRDLATALLRMEAVIRFKPREMATQALVIMFDEHAVSGKVRSLRR